MMRIRDFFKTPSFVLVFLLLLQHNSRCYGKSISSDTNHDENRDQLLSPQYSTNITNNTENVSKNDKEQVGIEYVGGDAFCGFKALRKNEDAQPDSEELPPTNQSHHRSRRFLSDFFGFQYRLKKWSKRTITWRLSNRNLKQLNYDEVREILMKAFKTWSDVVQLTFREVNSSYSDIQISFESGDHNCDDSFDGVGNKLAHAYGPGSGVLGDIHFDADENWVLSTDHSPFSWTLFRRPSLLNVAIHEIGHALGLYHSKMKESIMYEKYNQVESLHKTDREAIQNLYPNQTKPVPQPNPGKTFTPTIIRRCTFCEYAFCGCRQHCDICYLSTRGHRILII